MPLSDTKAPSRTLIPSIVADDDDDDDFQIPTKSLSFSPKPLSTKNPNSSKLLHPHSCAHPRKKPRRSFSGKENRQQVTTINVNGDERRNLLARGVGSTSGSGENRQVGSGTDVFYMSVEGKRIGDGKVRPLDPNESQICAQVRKVGSLERKRQVGEGVSPSSSELEQRCGLLENGDPSSPQSRPVDLLPYEGSIESRLLRSVVGGSSWNEGKGGEEDLGDGEEDLGDGEGDFDAGTQLRELMELCSEVNGKGNVGLGCKDDAGEEGGSLVGGEEMRSGVVKCPLCGIDITGMSGEMRNVHSNGCLDSGGDLKDAILDKEKNQLHQGTDYIQVREFLRSLELSRYEEVFVREEIDWDTLQWLKEEDLISIGVTALGPRKKIVHALNAIRCGGSNANELNSKGPESTTEKRTKVSIGNKLITEFFQGHSINRVVRIPSKPSSVAVSNEASVQRRVTARKPFHSTKSKDIPPWCSIPGTNFRVDAFRFLRGDCSHWFLTHFHLDHYQGLTKSFGYGKIYCSSITASLVNMKIGIPWERLHALPLDKKVNIGGVDVTCLDANHCPGSIIILFEPPDGKVVLHTGDFRFCEAIAGCSLLRLCNIHTLILDTTYCNPQYDFPKQEAVIQFVIEAIQAEAFNPKTLFLIGSYTVGKERLFLEVARHLRKKVYVGAAKLRLLQCLGFSKEDLLWFTSNEMESHIHVVPMWTIASFRRMKHVSNRYSGRYDLIVAFSPTGWTFGKGKKKSPGRRWQQGTIIRYEVPYSEHSSFSELQEFVQLVSPEIIVPSVNNTGKESADSMISLLTSDSQPGSTS